LLTALDAVNLKSDVELGATEQKFNILIHRDIQREYGVAPQVVFTMPILVGLDGVKKMSKSLGNYVGITESPQQMFGKLMSISDDLMWSYYELLTDFEERVIVRLREEVRTGVLHPMDAKMQLAHTIIANFHGEEAARAARDEFQRVFRDREAPEEVPQKNLARSGLTRVSTLVFISDLAASRAEAERLIKQGAIEIDGQRVDNVRAELDLSKPNSFLLRAGKKKFLRVIVE
ncbi:MAG: tyrosine--tRNA ligase, partial [Candidatus Acidiferrales bacterium]